MKIDRLASESAKDSIPRKFVELIEVVGKEDFGKRLYEVAAGLTGCRHVTAFLHSADFAPVQVITQDRQGGAHAGRCAEKYIREFWRWDPVSRQDLRSSQQSLFVITDSADITRDDYRGECYANVGLGERVAICGKDLVDNRQLRVNFYSESNKRFSDDCISILHQSWNMLFHLVRRHYELSSPDPLPGNSPEVGNRLKTIEPSLTQREAEVCTHIIRGLTSEGIALELDIALNTVLTYRKRAYARLGITSQNELLKLVMSFH